MTIIEIYDMLNEQLEDIIYDITYYLDKYKYILSIEAWFELLDQCFNKIPEYYGEFFIEVSHHFPQHINTYINYITWDKYINIIGYCLENKKLDNESCKKIIDLLITQLYEERYNDKKCTTLCLYLPREHKKLDKRTNIVKTLATHYYIYYMDKNKNNEWIDLYASDKIYNKNDALKLYRKDCSYLRNIYIQSK